MQKGVAAAQYDARSMGEWARGKDCSTLLLGYTRVSWGPQEVHVVVFAPALQS